MLHEVKAMKTKVPESKTVIAARIREAGARANMEAAERRAKEATQAPPKEIGGPKGPEPTRFGDWEKKGIAVDF
jgi:hypothetical protein